MTKYIALLRGINSGKNPATKMTDLAEVFTDLGVEDVKTIIASGNVVFTSDKTNKKTLEAEIEIAFEKKFKFHSAVTVRSQEEIESLINSEPFAKEPADAKTYVTFLKQPPKNLELADGKDYRILRVSETEVLSVIDLAETKTPDLMNVLDKTFGKEVTTRSWKTVERIAKTLNS